MYICRSITVRVTILRRSITHNTGHGAGLRSRGYGYVYMQVDNSHYLDAMGFAPFGEATPTLTVILTVTLTLTQLLYPFSHSYCQTRKLLLTLTLTLTLALSIDPLSVV